MVAPNTLLEGRYRIIQKLGHGGMGAVYQATDINLSCLVAVKETFADTDEQRRAFEREAKLLANLDHPSLPRVTHHFEHDGKPFLVMQFVPGNDLAELLALGDKPFATEKVLEWADQLLGALEELHSHQPPIIHRDIKPSNLKLTPKGKIILLDFGLAKGAAGQMSTLDAHSYDKSIYGYTKHYAPLEQIRGAGTDPRSDLYSLAATLWTLLTARTPPDALTRVAEKEDGNPDPLKLASDINPKVPQSVAAVLHQAMSLNRNQRPTSAVEMRNLLHTARHTPVRVREDEIPTQLITEQARPPVATKPEEPRPRQAVTRRKLLSIFVGISLALTFISIPLGFWLSGAIGTGGSVLSIGASKPVLRLHGSSTVGQKLVPALLQEFLKKEGAKDIKVTPGKDEDIIVEAVMPGDSSASTFEVNFKGGSDKGFDDLDSDSCDIAMASRGVSDEEVQKLSKLGNMKAVSNEHVIGLDGIAIIVNRNNPIQSLTKDQIQQIYSGQTTDWSQVQGLRGQIKVYVSEKGSGGLDAFQTLVMGKSIIVNSATVFDDNDKLSASVASEPLSIGYVGLPYIKNAKAVAISETGANPLLPTPFTVATEDYLLTRRLYLYTAASPKNDLVRKFVDFAVSDAGQDVVSKVGFVSQTVQGNKTTTVNASPAGAPPEYIRLTSGATRLSTNFRFLTRSSQLDNKAVADLDRVVEYLSSQNLPGENIILIGFADSLGSADTNLSLSKQRAEAAATEFRKRGITPREIAGLGSAMPIASNDTEDGKNKNRRVEIWVKQ